MQIHVRYEAGKNEVEYELPFSLIKTITLQQNKVSGEVQNLKSLIT